jgi:hypothetical protein
LAAGSQRPRNQRPARREPAPYTVQIQVHEVLKVRIVSK